MLMRADEVIDWPIECPLGGKTDIAQIIRECPLLTHSGHECFEVTA
jgi:hypothetical protein